MEISINFLNHSEIKLINELANCKSPTYLTNKTLIHTIQQLEKKIYFRNCNYDSI